MKTGYYGNIIISPVIIILYQLYLLGARTILKNMSSSAGKDDIPYMKWTIKFMFETTNQERLADLKTGEDFSNSTIGILGSKCFCFFTKKWWLSTSLNLRMWWYWATNLKIECEWTKQGRISLRVYPLLQSGNGQSPTVMGTPQT